MVCVCVCADDDVRPLPLTGPAAAPSLLSATLGDRQVAALLAGRPAAALAHSPSRNAGGVSQMINQLTDELKKVRCARCAHAACTS